VLLHQLLVSWGPEGFEAFVKRLQRKYAQQALAAAAAAEQHLGGLATWQPVTAGMFLWLRLTGTCGGVGGTWCCLGVEWMNACVSKYQWACLSGNE